MLNVRGCCAAVALLIHFVEYWFVYGEPPAGPERAKNRKLRLARILFQREKTKRDDLSWVEGVDCARASFSLAI